MFTIPSQGGAPIDRLYRRRQEAPDTSVLLALCAIAALFVACQATPLPDRTPLALSPVVVPALPGPSTAPFPGLAWTFNGKAVDARFVTLIDAPEACGFPKVQLLTVGKPFGQEMHTDRDSMQFVRDPNNLVQDKTVVPFNPSTQLPPNAYFTGLKYDDLEVWAANEMDEAIYIVRGDTVERWPRAREFIACA